MQLGLTIPLQKQLKLPKQECGEAIDLFFCWELHIIRYQGKNTLIAVNANNRFFVMLSNMKSADWNEIGLQLKYAIEQGMLSEGYTKEQAEAYFDLAGEPVFVKTHGKKALTELNSAMDCLSSILEEVDHYEKYQPFHCAQINKDLCQAIGFRDYGYPVDFFMQDMKRVGICS